MPAVAALAAAAALAAPSLVSVTVGSAADERRLAALGLDTSEVVSEGRAGVVVRSSADLRALRQAGLRPVRAPDAATTPRAARAQGPGLPSGRTAYRRLEDYGADMARLARVAPDLVRPVRLPGASVQGRPLVGLELAEDVRRRDDGRPVHVLVGLHHAREWSSGEVVLEHAFDLVARRGRDARVDRVLRRVRTVVVPVLNPDGLLASQAAGLDVPDPDGAMAAQGIGAYRRKNCAGATNGGCGPGVDLNRNYGAFWGGAGSSADPASQAYRGPAPYSEPESRAFRDWSSRRHVAVVNAVHNYGGTVLHQPGFARESQPGFPAGSTLPGAHRMAAVARAMAGAAGYAAGPASALGDITGAAEDWNTFAQGAFGFTTEVGYDGFHPGYQDAVIDQFLGTVDGPLNAQAGRPPSLGLREAFLRGGEAAADVRTHAVLEGQAPPGRVLRLVRRLRTATSFADGARQLPDRLRTSLRVPASGRFTWHVNPSTRPVAALAGRREAWTLRCERPGGAVLERRRVIVALGGRATLRLRCGGG